MLEREAWAFIKSIFENTDNFKKEWAEYRVGYKIKDKKFYSFGMCMIIEYLCDMDVICVTTCNSMLDKIKAALDSQTDKDYDGYLFPCDLEGAKERVKFCEERMNEL